MQKELMKYTLKVVQFRFIFKFNFKLQWDFLTVGLLNQFKNF